MKLARVIAPIWGDHRTDALLGQRLLQLEVWPADATAPKWVAADSLGAGPGEFVLVAHGSRCRDLTIGAHNATKDVVVAIVDNIDID